LEKGFFGERTVAPLADSGVAMSTNDTTELTAAPFDTINSLQQLISISKDSEDGFREAADGVRNADLKELFSMVATQRREFGAELKRIVLSLDEDPETSKDFAGEVRLLWLELAAALSAGNEHTVLFECERGEDAALNAYREVLKNVDLAPEIRVVVEHQWEAVQKSHARIRHLRLVSDPAKQPPHQKPAAS
jgi:uncharacterized protein (TIGR02284 family)